MPLNPEVLGTEKDGSKTEEYCTHCYAERHFTEESKLEKNTHCTDPYLAFGVWNSDVWQSQ